MSLVFYGALSLFLLVYLILTEEIELAVIYFVGLAMGSLIGINMVKQK